MKFKYNQNHTLQNLEDFKDTVNLCIKKALKNKVTSLVKLHHLCYKDLTSKYDYSSQYSVSAIKTALAIVNTVKKKNENRG